jgi:glycosyltransferase involved in cell wall biosynthesis
MSWEEQVSNRQANTFVFITFDRADYSRSSVYLDGLRSRGYLPTVIELKMKGIKRYSELRRALKKIKNNNAVYVIMNPCHVLTPFVRILVGNFVVLDAGWPLLDGLITREVNSKFSVLKLKTFFIDYFAAHFASLILLETNEQVKHYSRKFLVSRDKCNVLFTGVNEIKFTRANRDEIKIHETNASNFKVFYRGQHTPLAAIEILAETSFLLENYNIDFEIFSPGLPKDIVFSAKSSVDREYQKNLDAISKSFMESSLVIGFLSFHKRLSRTIPHKAFEAAFFGKPYLTVDSIGISEFLESGIDAIFIESNNPKDLAVKILYLSKHKEELAELARNIHSKYLVLSSQEVLTNEFIKAASRIK